MFHLISILRNEQKDKYVLIIQDDSWHHIKQRHPKVACFFISTGLCLTSYRFQSALTLRPDVGTHTSMRFRTVSGLTDVHIRRPWCTRHQVRPAWRYQYDHINDVNDLPELLKAQITHFFEHYKDLEKGKWVKVDGWDNAEAAKAEIVASFERAAKK